MCLYFLHTRSILYLFIFFVEDIKKMETDYKDGVLKEKMDERYKNPNVTQAILEFFEKR